MDRIYRIISIFIFIATTFFIGCHTSDLYAQNVKSLYKLLDKKEFQKLDDKLTKTLTKDSLNAPSYFFYSLYYLDTANKQHYHIDSSYSSLKKGIELFSISEAKEKSGWVKDGLTEELFHVQQEKIESVAFDSAKARLTEDGFVEYLSLFPESKQATEAITVRDSIAFSTAEKVGTYVSYKNFMDKYPNAIQSLMAEERYNVLLYRNKTVGGSKEELSKFLREHPNSPFFKETEYRLYELYREKHQLSEYEQFVNDQSLNSFALDAWNWIWYLTPQKDQFFKKYPYAPKKDHYHQLAIADTSLYYAYFSNESKKFGFFDYTGETKINSLAYDLPEDYLCGSIADEYLLIIDEGKMGAINKIGEEILPAQYDDIEPFDPGTLLTWKDDQCGLASLAGFVMIDCNYDDLYPLENGLIKAQKYGKWGIISYYGKELFPFVADEIKNAGLTDLLIKKNGHYQMLPYHAIWEDKTQDYSADHIVAYEKMPRNFIKLLDRDSLTSLVNEFGKKIIPPAKQEILPSESGWILEKDNSYTIYNDQGKKLHDNPYQKVIEGKMCYAVKFKDKWGGMRFNGEAFLQPSYDTIFFLGNNGLGLLRDNQQFVYFQGNEELVEFSGYKDLKIQWGNSTDSDSLGKVPFIIAKEAKRRGQSVLMNAKGKVLMKSSYDEINILDGDIIEVRKKAVKGLYSLKENKTLTKIQYEGIAKDQHEGDYSLFMNSKFGLFLSKNKRLIPTEYDKLLKPYGTHDSLYIARKGKFGIINDRNNTVASFIFDELQYWNDSVALVLHQKKWKLYNFKARYYLPEVFETYQWVKNTEEERMIITYRSSGYGILSSKNGRIVVEEFSDIINLGSAEKPLFFVERAISQVGLYVILYFDEDGKLIREGILREDAYQKLICPDV